MKKIRFLFFLALLLMTAVGAKAGSFAVTSADIGKVICTNGKLYANVEAAEAENKTPVAMIAYVGTNKGLAIALREAYVESSPACAWTNMNTHLQNWVTSNDYYVGYATWKVPTIEEWQQMLIGCGATGSVSNTPTEGLSNLSFTELNTRLGNAGGCIMLGDYWSETQNTENYAWSLEISNNCNNNDNNIYAAFWSYSKEYEFQVRPCLAFDVPEPRKFSYSEAKVGSLICTNGRVLASWSEQEQSDNPVAMITYVDTKRNKGLAISLIPTQQSPNWYDAENCANEWNSNVQYAVVGCNWKLPTATEWQQMLIGCGAEGTVNNDPTDVLLSLQIDTILGSYRLSGPPPSQFWSATENVNNNDEAWYADFSQGDNRMHFVSYNKVNHGISVRPCLTFDIEPLRDITAATTKDIGKIVGTDGKIYEKRSELPNGVNAAAMLAYVDKKNHKGLAIALADVSAQYLRAQQGGMAQWVPVSTFMWESAKSRAEGYTPLVPNGTWKLPSVDEFKNMLFGCGDVVYGNNNFVTCVQMESKLVAIGGASIHSNNSTNYWLEDENGNYQAWSTYYYNQGGYYEFSSTTNKDEQLKARACLTFDLVSTASASEGVIATTADVGKVLCTDGSVYSDIFVAQQHQKTPVAMIAYVDTVRLEGLALALKSVGDGKQWTDTEAAIENWVSTYDYELTDPNMTWKLPTKNDWQNMILGCGGSIENDTINYSGLQTKLWNCTDGNAVFLQNYYWTADEYDEYHAWSLGFHLLQGGTPDYALFSYTGKTSEYYIYTQTHACIAFNVADTVKIFATKEHVGKVLCTDGSIYATVTEARNNKKTPAAMITYVDMVNKKGLAIALEDESRTYEGQQGQYTVSTFTWRDALEKAAEHTPVIVGSNWKQPTVLEWQQMLIGCIGTGTADGSVYTSISYSEMNDMLYAAEGATLTTESVDYYWTDTQEDTQWGPHSHVLTFSNNQAHFSGTYDQGNQAYVRACLEFDISEPDPLSLAEAEVGLGKIVCTDGSIYEAGEVPVGKIPVGMIAFIDMEQETGLVIALKDDSIIYNEGTQYERAYHTMDKATATSIVAAHTPAIPGNTWRLPTIDEWKQMLLGTDPSGYGVNEFTFSSVYLNSSLDAVGDSLLGGYYWSSTLKETPNGQEGYIAYFYDNSAYCGSSTGLSGGLRVRACFPFNINLTKYPITIDDICINNVTSNRAEAAEGETVGLTITNIPEGEYVDYVNVYYHNDYDYDVPVEVTRSNYNDNVFTFTMPPYPVTVTYVGFLPIPVAQEYDGIYYTLNYRNHYAEVAPHPDHAYSGAINVPSMFMLDNRDYYVTSVGREAFANYSNNEISSVTLGGNVGIIRRDAFYNSTIASLSLGNHLSTIEQYAFRKGNYPIVIPSTVDSISNWAFKGFQGSSMSVENGNSKFSSPDNCNAIIETATNTIVAGCRNSSIPSTVTTIGLAAFDSVGLATITIPANVTTIEHGAFANNPITSVNIPATVTEIDNNPFYGCKQLASITVDANNSKFDSRNGCNAICDKTRRWIIATCKNSVIPADITGIGTYAFAYREDLNEFKVPSNISLINDNAFAYSNLWNITLADNNDLIIGRWAFAQCKELRTVKMGRGISRIDEQVLIGCPKLSNIYVNAALVPKITSTTFHIDDAGNRTTAKVHVPSASLKTYQKNNLWKLLNLVPSDAVQGVTATFESVNNTKCSAVGEGLELITEEGTIWDCSTSSASITTHGGETCLQVSSSSVTLSDCSTNGFIITDSVKRIVVRAANVTDITCEIVDISENPDASLNQTQSVTGLTASDAFQDFALNFDDSKKYSKAKVNVTITGTSPIYVQSISIIQGGGDYVITDEEQTTVQGIEYSNNMSAPANAQDAEAIIDNVPVYVYTTCLPTAPVRDTGLKFYTLSSSTNTSLQFAEVTGALAANTPYLVAVSQDAEIGMSVENESVTLKKESDNYSLSSDGAYKFVGTTTGLTNAEAVAASAYILQDGNVWGQVTAENFEAYIPPFRAYIVPTGPSSRSMLSGGFTDATGIKTLQLTDRDGTKHYFDLNGRRISSPAASGVYVTNGKKVIIKK